MRFPPFQKLEDTAVVAETPDAMVEPIEDVTIVETTPTAIEV
jgi:hypothetical protein